MESEKEQENGQTNEESKEEEEKPDLKRKTTMAETIEVYASFDVFSEQGFQIILKKNRSTFVGAILKVNLREKTVLCPCFEACCHL